MSNHSILVRWMKFNFVGGMGVVVQFAVLFLLKGVLHFHYLIATVIAVEAAVVHNFVWHEQFTWADRAGADRTMPTWRVRRTSGAEAPNSFSAIIRALKRCAAQKLLGPNIRRLFRFHLANGAISILGNVSIMRVMVGEARMNYLAANGIAIALCSVANFVVSNAWVFEDEPLVKS
ncbi:MAG TPA: GtrA family protein [Terriglobales bacterium]|nr:GtrA family protein [Terriglobales bacterium]